MEKVTKKAENASEADNIFKIGDTIASVLRSQGIEIEYDSGCIAYQWEITTKDEYDQEYSDYNNASFPVNMNIPIENDVHPESWVNTLIIAHATFYLRYYDKANRAY